MAEEAKKYVDPNPYAGYGAAMKSTPGDPMAVEWQKAHETEIAAATTPKALAAHLWEAKDADALLAKLKGAYDTDPLVMTEIGAVTQYVMEFSIGRTVDCQKRCGTPGAAPCRRRIWLTALLKAFRATKDEYLQTFVLDQMRWCACKCHAPKIRALADAAASAHVKEYIDWTASEADGSAF